MQALDHLVGEGGVRQRHSSSRLNAILQEVVDEAGAICLGFDTCEGNGQIYLRQLSIASNAPENQCAFSRFRRRLIVERAVRCFAASSTKPLAIAITESTKTRRSSALATGTALASRCSNLSRLISASYRSFGYIMS